MVAYFSEIVMQVHIASCLVGCVGWVGEIVFNIEHRMHEPARVEDMVSTSTINAGPLHVV